MFLGINHYFLIFNLLGIIDLSKRYKKKKRNSRTMIRVYLFYLLKSLYNYLLKLNFEVYKHTNKY